MGGCYNYSCTAAKTHVDPILSFIQLLSCLACTNFSKNTAYGNFFPCIEYVSTISLYTIGQRWTEAEMKLFHWAFSTIQWKILNISGDGSLFSLNIKLLRKTPHFSVFLYAQNISIFQHPSSTWFFFYQTDNALASCTSLTTYIYFEFRHV